MTNRELAKLIFLSGVKPTYVIVVRRHETTARAYHLHGTYVGDYKLGCAMVRAIRKEIQP